MNSDALALARRLAELDQKETAQQAYTLVLQQSDGSDPAAEISVQPRILSSGIDGSDDAGLLSAQCGSAAEMLSGKL